MKKIILFLSAALLTACCTTIESPNPVKNDNDIVANDASWRMGAKIHFTESSGTDYLGIKEVNKITKDALKSLLKIDKDSGADNAKILLKKEGDKLIMTHYEEKSRPDIGEELHATLLYTRARGFHNSETLHQVCHAIFKDCHESPPIENVVKEYNYIIKPDFKFKISEIILTNSSTGRVFIQAKLRLNERENIYKGNKAISGGLHMTLVNCEDNSLFLNSDIGKKLIEKLNKALRGQTIKIGTKDGIVDLEFGLSGQPWRIRAGKRVEFQPQ